MNIVRRLDSYIDAFMRLSPFAKRVVTILLCIVLLRLVVTAHRTGHDSLADYLTFFAVVGLCWATGFWYVLRGALILLAWWLRIFR
ncbi:hypothetical protein [Paraburkholderia phenazinium]|uniref:hypothetical protein n=1 Tax=Paraburkholderia phenazinium TaxID=60549 RepID=UPI0015891E10|nr:hypothetical protein [Paraburkholderia phenazinium]